MLRLLLIAAGWLSLALGIVGVVVPLLPTTPFVLLAAACFARSSERFHHWLLGHRFFGPIIQGYLDGSGIPRRAKVTAVSMALLTLPPSTVLLVPSRPVQVALFLLAALLVIYLMRLPTRKEN